ncbi:hypothetical protein GUY56_18415 [Lysinibacillus fusiformis]|uniref:hypothetical protein n=1 Tax=Lysinibacillus fusiformis TaxID=28031 RepID=UPI0004D700F4|nr:hypothetical protein [Lysinibacillus sphaericus]KEK11475.1 hypothetical protein EP18_13075 [Lysinibacillus sphaericus]
MIEYDGEVEDEVRPCSLTDAEGGTRAKNRKTIIAPELKKLDEMDLQQTRWRFIENSADTSRSTYPIVIFHFESI